MDKRIVVEVTQEDADKAGGFGNPRTCLFAQTLRRTFPEHTFYLGFRTLELIPKDGSAAGMYWVNEADLVRDAYVPDSEEIRKPFKPFTVTLRKMNGG